MIYGVPESDLQLIINEIKQKLGNTIEPKLYIYGSRAKASYRPFSDIDLLLTAKVFDEVSLERCDFESLNTPYKVDFVLEKNLYLPYKEEIFAHMKELVL